jgi:hypothetical protein
MLTVSVKKGQTYLQVNQAVSVERWPHLRALSSERRAPNIGEGSTRWQDGLAWSIADRLRNGGDRKGRVVAIWQEPREGAPTPLAALSWHREEAGPFYLLDAGARIDLAKGARAELLATLLKIMLDASRHPGAGVAEEWRSSLRWATVHFKRAPNAVRKDYAKAALRRARGLNFEQYRPPPPAPRAMIKSWLGERQF